MLNLEENSKVYYISVLMLVFLGPGGPQSGFSTPRYVLHYVRRDFRKKKSGPPPPPPVPPRAGFFLVWSAEGLPSTRNCNWPFRAGGAVWGLGFGGLKSGPCAIGFDLVLGLGPAYTSLALRATS
jgi:hypothetical protein